jgi:hypothetical protein
MTFDTPADLADCQTAGGYGLGVVVYLDMSIPFGTVPAKPWDAVASLYDPVMAPLALMLEATVDTLLIGSKEVMLPEGSRTKPWDAGP